LSECKKRLEKLEVVPFVDADTETNLNEITVDLVNELSSLALVWHGESGSDGAFKESTGR